MPHPTTICTTCQGTGVVTGLHNWSTGGKRSEKCWNCPTYVPSPEDAIPEGCTPKDAQVLREANHAMAEQLEQAKARIADILMQDGGQAYKEGRKWLDRMDPEYFAAYASKAGAKTDSPSASLSKADALADSQYLAGVSAGWNAANSDDPNAALQKLHDSRAGYLKPLHSQAAPKNYAEALQLIRDIHEAILPMRSPDFDHIKEGSEATFDAIVVDTLRHSAPVILMDRGHASLTESTVNPTDTFTGPEGEWYCESHPDQLMGHDGCGGAGIPACARIGMLQNHLRLARQEIREAGMLRDYVVAAARRAVLSAEQPAAPRGVSCAELPEASPETKGRCNTERACPSCYSDQGVCEVAPQGGAYAELPDPVWRTLAGVAFSEKQMREFADRTHARRTQATQADSQSSPEYVKAPERTGVDPEHGPMLEAATPGELAFYDYAVHQHCQATLDILDGKDTGAGASNEPWAGVRSRLLELMNQNTVGAEFEGVVVGRLPTVNQDEYPGLGAWWVQIRTGPNADEVVSRVYGNSPAQAMARAQFIALELGLVQTSKKAQAEEESKSWSGLKLTKIPLDADNRMLRLGVGLHGGAPFLRADLWSTGYRITKNQKD